MRNARIGILMAAVILVSACSAGATPTPAPTAAPTPTPAATGAPASEGPTEIPGPGAPEKTTLKLVQGSDPDFTQVALTKAIEYMKDRHGVTVEFASVVDTDTATRSVIAGSQDMVVNSLYFGINAVKAGIGLKTIMVDVAAVDYLLMGTSDIATIQDLAGQTVGINKPGDLGATIADQCLKFSNVDPETVTYVQVGGTSARMSALLSGQIKSAPAHAAEALNAEKTAPDKVHVLANCGEAIGTFLQTGASSTDEWLAANPNLAQLFVDSYIDAIRWGATDKAGYLALSKEVVPDLDDEIREAAYAVLVSGGVFAVNGGLNAASVKKLVDIGLDADSIEEPIPDTWYTFEFVDSYLARNGEQ